MSLSIAVALQAAQPKVEGFDFQTKLIYHSPETPAYTSWVGLGKTPEGIYWSADTGKTWEKLNTSATDYGPGIYHYPIARQMDDGEILVIGHRGWDDVYGTVDQMIMQQRSRLRVTR